MKKKIHFLQHAQVTRTIEPCYRFITGAMLISSIPEQVTCDNCLKSVYLQHLLSQKQEIGKENVDL